MIFSEVGNDYGAVMGFSKYLKYIWMEEKAS